MVEHLRLSGNTKVHGGRIRRFDPGWFWFQRNPTVAGLAAMVGVALFPGGAGNTLLETSTWQGKATAAYVAHSHGVEGSNPSPCPKAKTDVAAPGLRDEGRLLPARTTGCLPCERNTEPGVKGKPYPVDPPVMPVHGPFPAGE